MTDVIQAPQKFTTARFTAIKFRLTSWIFTKAKIKRRAWKVNVLPSSDLKDTRSNHFSVETAAYQ